VQLPLALIAFWPTLSTYCGAQTHDDIQLEVSFDGSTYKNLKLGVSTWVCQQRGLRNRVQYSSEVADGA
jgi:hypothetical protein